MGRGRRSIVDLLSGQHEVRLELGVAHVLQPELLQSEGRPPGVQPGLVGGDDRSAAREECLHLGREPIVERDLVGEDEHLVPAQVALGINVVELVLGLDEHVVCAAGCAIDATVLDAEGLRVEDGDLGLAFGLAEPRLEGLDVAVDAADQSVGLRAGLACRVELVANGAFRSMCDLGEDLVFEGFLVLERGEVAPGGVELAGHPEALQPQPPCVAHGNREVGIAPAAAWEALELEVGVGVQNRPPARIDVPRVMEDGAVGVEPTYELRELALVLIDDALAVRNALSVVGRVHTGFGHALHADRAAAPALADDVEEQAVHVEHPQDLTGLVGDIPHIGPAHVEAHLVPARVERARGWLAVGAHLAPLGVLLVGVLVEADGDVDGNTNALGVAGLDLLGEEVALEVRVASVLEPGVMEDHPVVPAREACHGVDVRFLQCSGELPGIELRADADDLLGGVEVEVYLPESEFVQGVHSLLGCSLRRRGTALRHRREGTSVNASR